MSADVVELLLWERPGMLADKLLWHEAPREWHVPITEPLGIAWRAEANDPVRPVSIRTRVFRRDDFTYRPGHGRAHYDEVRTA